MPRSGSRVRVSFSALKSPVSPAEKRSGGGMVDTRDLKSLARKGVWVQVPPGVLNREKFEMVDK